MKQWLEIMDKVLSTGVKRQDRTGTGTIALFGEHMEFDVSKRFPAVTTKQLGFGQVKAELACFLRGYDSLDSFHAMGCNIWDANGTASYWASRAGYPGYLGRIYGVQWRQWKSTNVCGVPCHTDQLKTLVEGLIKDPHGRRHVVTAWNPGELDQMCLPPCHILFQAFSDGGHLDLVVYMRSVDLFLGLPFDVASYALLMTLLGRSTGLKPRKLAFFLGDCHVYNNHVDQVRLVCSRAPLEGPVLQLGDNADLLNFDPSEAWLQFYNSHGAVPAPMSV